MRAGRVLAVAAFCAILLAAPASANCVDWGLDLKVCGTADMDVTTNDLGLPVHEATQEQRLTQIFWTAAGDRMQSPDELEPFFWDVRSAVATRLEERGTITIGPDYAANIRDRPVRGNSFTLLPEADQPLLIVRLEVFETHGFPVAIELIEPYPGSNTAANNALIVQAMDMIQVQGAGQ